MANSLVKSISLILFYIYFHQISCATSTPSNLQIKSDRLTLNQKESTATFKGSVTLIFDNMTLNSSLVIVYYNEKNGKKTIEKIIIPNKLIATKEIAEETVIADKGEYINNISRLTLSGGVKLKQRNNFLVTDQLIYLTKIKLISKTDAK